MSIFVERIPNKPIDSNSFVISTQGHGECIIIDPGSEDCNDLIVFIERIGLKPKFIFLTHEHFDHIWGVNKLKEIYDCKIVCSFICAERITKKKKNMSLFYNQVGFESYPADIYVEDIFSQLDWNGKNIEFISTKGHTDASICILIDNNLFTGDTIIKGNKTVVKLPGGSKVKLLNSLSLLFSKFSNKKLNVYPGHGENFCWNEVTIEQIV